MLELWHRIPETWMALILGFVGAWVYLKLQSKHTTRDIVLDKLFGALLAFVILDRFSGVLFHPSANLREDLGSLIGGSPPYGWLLGLGVSTVYLGVSLRKANALDQKTLRLVVQTMFVGAIPFLAFHAFKDLHPYRLEDIVRLICTAILYAWSLRKNVQPFRVFAAASTVLLVSSLMVPHFNPFLMFDGSQWAFLFVIVASLAIEAIQDIKRSKASTPSDIADNGEV